MTDLKLLVLDEPTGADPSRFGGCSALIRRLKGRGASVIYISHFLEEIEEIADRFTVLHDGRAVGEASRVRLAGNESSN